MTTLASRPWVAQCRLTTPLGPMSAAATARGLGGLWFDGQAHHPGPLAAPWQAHHPVLRHTAEVLAAYFECPGQVLAALPPLDLGGTPLQQAVWQALLSIAPGQTKRYGELAAALGRPAAARAVGAAVGRNPVSVLVPCHRVLGANGALTGYAGGLDRKRALLRAESIPS
jgi:methylated-DNA-[protein]-cysteine S-methyltransferase